MSKPTREPMTSVDAAWLGMDRPTNLMIINGVAVLITAGYANARTMMARLAPPEKMTEFFGLMSLSGTAATPFANMSVTIMTAWTLSQRGGLLAIIGFLAVGLVLMAFVKEERAVAV